MNCKNATSYYSIVQQFEQWILKLLVIFPVKVWFKQFRQFVCSKFFVDIVDVEKFILKNRIKWQFI